MYFAKRDIVGNMEKISALNYTGSETGLDIMNIHKFGCSILLTECSHITVYQCCQIFPIVGGQICPQAKRAKNGAKF